MLCLGSCQCIVAQDDTIALKQAEVSAQMPEQLYQGLYSENPLLLSPTDNLNFITGIAAFEGTSNTAKFSYRGLGTRSQFTTSRSLFYLAEVPLTDGQGYTTFEDLSPQWFPQPYMPDKTRGLYPSALGGVFICDPLAAKGNLLENEIYTGSFGLLRNTSTLHTSAANYRGVLGYEYASRDGWRENSRLERQSLFYHDRWTLAGKHRLSALVLAIRNFSAIPSSVDLVTFNEHPEEAAPGWAQTKGYEQYDKVLAGITFERSLRDKTRWATTAFYRFRDGFEPRPFNILDELWNTAGLRSSWEQKLSIGSRLTHVSAFAEMMWEQADARTYVNLYDSVLQSYNHPGALINKTSVRSNRVTAGVGYTAPLLRLDRLQRTLLCEVGITGYYQYNVLVSEDRDDYDIAPIPAPYLALRYEAQRSTAYLEPSLRFYRSYAIPSVEENLNPDGQLNTTLKPELAWTGEFLLKGRSPNRRWPYSIVMYYTQVKNLIIPRVAGPDQVVVTNSGTSMHTGLELSFNPSWTSGRFTLQPSASGYFGYFVYRTFSDTAGIYNGHHLPGFPDKQLNINLQVWFDNTVFAGITGRFTEGYAIDDANTVFTEPYTFWQCWAGTQFDAGKRWNFVLRAGIKNIWDEHYAAMTVVNNRAFGGTLPRYYYPGEPRNWFASAKVAYRWKV